MNTEKKWCVIHTKPKLETKVADLLSKKKIETYCPLTKQAKQSTIIATAATPLFNSYVFVNATEEQYKHIQHTEGVVNFVYWLGKPAVIKEEEIAAVRRYLNESYTLSLEKINVDINGIVRVTAGPVMQQEGDVIEVKEKSLKIHLPTLGYALIAVENNVTEVVKTTVSTFTNLREKSKQLFNNVNYKNLLHANFR